MGGDSNAFPAVALLVSNEGEFILFPTGFTHAVEKNTL